MNKRNELGLINYEGDCLKAKKKSMNEYVISDQHGVKLATWNLNKFCDFLDGKLEIKDSAGKSWNYQREHHEARPNTMKLVLFINELV